MTPLVFLPGMMCDARLFLPQIAALSAARPVVCASFARQDSIAAMAGAVLDLVPGRFAVAGLSMGGIVAMELVRQAPDRVAALALMDTNPLAERPDVQAGRAAQIARALSGDLAGLMAEVFVPRYAGAQPLPQPVQDTCHAMARDLGPQVFARQSVALRDRSDQQQALAGYAGPALVLNGSADQLCPPDRHHLMAGLLPQAARVEIPGAGHLPTLETPEVVTRALVPLLEAA